MRHGHGDRNDSLRQEDRGLRRTRRERARAGSRAPQKTTPGRIVQASSLGAEDHGPHRPDRDAIACRSPSRTLETGMLHGETLALIDAIRERYDIRVERLPPGARSRDRTSSAATARTRCDEASSCARRCCAMRKVEPLAACSPAARRGSPGLRREQSSERGDVTFERARRRRPQQVQPARRLELGRRLALPRRQRRPLQRAPRPLLPEHRLRALHARDRRRRRLPRRPLVVGAEAPRNAACTSPPPASRDRSTRHERADAARPPAPARARPRPPRRLEEEAIFILRETAAAFERPALLFSGGKDSCVVLHLAAEGVQARRADGEDGRLPFPLLHVDTGHNFPEVIEFRDRRRRRDRRAAGRRPPRGLDRARQRSPRLARSNRATATRA